MVLLETPFSLEGETALITGGGTGLGLGMAECFVAAGASVVLVGRREQELRAAAARLGCRWMAHDITETDRAKDLIEQAGPISILVNNAGVHLKKRAVETSVADFQTVLDTHVLGAHALTTAALPSMIENLHGSVLFIASMASFMGVPLVMAYSAAKSAYLGMVRTLAAEVSGQGVRVNAIAPGWIETPLLEKAMANDPSRRERVLARTPMARFGSPQDIGWAAVYLCSPAAGFVTGTVLPVDGGASVGF